MRPREDVADAGADTSVRKDSGPTHASACAPETLTPTDVPGGFLPAEKVTLNRAVDGDTAHFDFPSKPDQICRFLFVNTEESYGENTTDFGVRTKATVRAYLQEAGEIVAVVREKPGSPGEPDRDDYSRMLCLVFVDGDLFQTRLVREGLSAYYTQYGCAPEPVDSALLGAEEFAHAEKLGIWKEDHPTDYAEVLKRWIGGDHCRPNPFEDEAYCP